VPKNIPYFVVIVAGYVRRVILGRIIQGKQAPALAKLCSIYPVVGVTFPTYKEVERYNVLK
jgi:hypothetical protein